MMLLSSLIDTGHFNRGLLIISRPSNRLQFDLKRDIQRLRVLLDGPVFKDVSPVVA